MGRVIRRLLGEFPKPNPGHTFFNDGKVRACIGNDRDNVKGHTIVEWIEEEVQDLNELSEENYIYLMKVVYAVRQALLEVYKTDKVYLAYLDESYHVHWKLYPRRNCSIHQGSKLMNLPTEKTPKSDLKVREELESLVEENLDKWPTYNFEKK